jgi:hypothetical protein
METAINQGRTLSLMEYISNLCKSITGGTIKLADYKGKFTIGVDEYDTWDNQVGEIPRKQFINELDWRVADADYYGVPAYYGKDKEIHELIAKIRKDNDLD